MIMTKAICPINSGMLAEAKAAAIELRAQTHARQQAIFYEFFIDRENEVIISVEAYQDSEGMLAHITAESFDRFQSAVTVKAIDFYGDASAELMEAMSQLPVTYFASI